MRVSFDVVATRRFLVGLAGLSCLLAALVVAFATSASAQSFRFNSIEIDGNVRIEDSTILSYAALPRGEAITAGQLNAAFQRIQDSGLFEAVELIPRGNTLRIAVREYPTINRVAFEGNRRIGDDALAEVVASAPRRIYSPSQAEADADAVTAAYREAGRLAAEVEPKIIRRSNNRVDLVFEIIEGAVVETQRISFVGNRTYSDRRLRRVVESKQAGLLRALIRSDTFIADRIEFDKQVLTDFYRSRGFVDFQILDVTAELSRERDGYFITFTLREGQSFDFAEVTVTSDLEEIDPDEFLTVSRIRSGQTYSPTQVENTITRMERLALQKGLNFIRVEPRVRRNDAALTLDVEFLITRGPRVFVERIDIEGNSTTLDRVVRREFRIAEGDPFNPRQIRAAAERIRALNFFRNVEVSAREGSAPDQVVVDVDVEEAPTGSLGFGANYSIEDGLGFAVTFTERNFLGRGQFIGLTFNSSSDNQEYTFDFREPKLLGRDLTFGFLASYRETSGVNDADFDTRTVVLSPSVAFPLSENGRLQLRYRVSQEEISDVNSDSSRILAAEEGDELRSEIGYTYSYDTRRTGLNPAAGVLLQFSQDLAGFGGDSRYVRTTARALAERRVAREEVTLRAAIEGGALYMLDDDGISRITDRFRISSRQLRGFSGGGIGPRDLNATNRDALGGNYYAVARFEAEFPLGLPEEYGVRGGAFFDIGSLWDLDNVQGGPQGPFVAGNEIDDDFYLRSTVGVSLFFDSALGPLRFNFSHPLERQSYDRTRSFDFTISTRF